MSKNDENIASHVIIVAMSRGSAGQSLKFEMRRSYLLLNIISVAELSDVVIEGSIAFYQSSRDVN